MIPIAILAKTKDNDPKDLFHENGVHKTSSMLMTNALFEAMDKNMRKKVKVLSDEQFIEVFEASVEWMAYNQSLNKKVILSDIIKQKI